jgi:effector-binding domain-containing protein
MLLVSPRRAVLLGVVMSLVLLVGCGGEETAEQDVSPDQTPQIYDLPAQKMAVVYTTGDPGIVGPQAVSALYASVSALLPKLKEKGIDFELSAVRVRWPNMYSSPRDQWTGIWGLPIPIMVDSLAQIAPDIEVKIEIWPYGEVAQILHIGPYAAEGPTIQRLMDFIVESGYEVAGSHEEIYLTPPSAQEQKTFILYPIKRR